MENYLNATGEIIGLASGQIIQSVFGMVDAKKQRELQEELGKLDLAQQKELTERLQNVQGEIAKQQAFYQFLAVQNNNEMLNKLKSKRYTSYIVLGGGVLALALVIIILKKKKNG